MRLSWAGFASRVTRQRCSLQNQTYVAARRQVADLRAATDHFLHNEELSGLGCDFYGSVTYRPPLPPPPWGILRASGFDCETCGGSVPLKYSI